MFPLESLRLYPKASSRKVSNRGRKTKKSAIYTDTPVKEAIRKEYEERQKRFKNKQTKKNYWSHVLKIQTMAKQKGKEKEKMKR